MISAELNFNCEPLITDHRLDTAAAVRRFHVMPVGMILELVGIAVTVISIIVTIISIWQTGKNKRHQKSNRPDQS